MSGKKCLFCYQRLDNSDQDFHKKCSNKIFGNENAPLLELSLNEVENYAVNLLRGSVSLTGVQPKLSVDIEKNKNKHYRLTIVGLWGQYILKPPHSDYPEMPEIEDLTMGMAALAGIKTAEHSLIRMKSGELSYLSRRFDRTPVGKLHVEDFAQLLEVLTERKYSGSIERIGKYILKYSSFPGNDLINLFELVLFCFLTGNSDMHLKNYSLIRDELDDIKLSPAYDLLSTKILLPVDSEEYAITINGKKSNLSKNDFDKLASNFNISKKTTMSIYRKFENAFKSWNTLIENSFISDSTKRKYLSLIQSRFRKMDIGTIQ
ncbi:MAG: HipA domain-containing protein [Ignavibacteriaceae bacterium]|nr:HipA domain-containing protein [Ignavibacteriaceae bacterium]